MRKCPNCGKTTTSYKCNFCGINTVISKMKKLLTLFVGILCMSCEPKELNFSVSCEFNYKKYEEGVLIQTGRTVREFYSPKTAKELEEQFSGNAKVLGKYELYTIVTCKPL
jgi:hypothetical protein